MFVCFGIQLPDLFELIAEITLMPFCSVKFFDFGGRFRFVIHRKFDFHFLRSKIYRQFDMPVAVHVWLSRLRILLSLRFDQLLAVRVACRSKPVNGSSSSNNSGEAKCVRANASRCFIPRENVCTIWLLRRQ